MIIDFDSDDASAREVRSLAKTYDEAVYLLGQRVFFLSQFMLLPGSTRSDSEPYLARQKAMVASALRCVARFQLDAKWYPVAEKYVVTFAGRSAESRDGERWNEETTRTPVDLSAYAINFSDGPLIDAPLENEMV